MCLLLAVCLSPFVSAASSFRATLEPETIAVGDNASLQLIFEGDGQIGLSELPSIPGLVISGPQQARSFSDVNGVRTYSLTVSYSLRPERSGTFSIPPFTAQIGTETFTSRALELKAVDTPQPPLSGGLAALRVVTPRNRLFVGESMRVELQLVLNQAVSDISDFQMPDLSGDGWLTSEPVQGRNSRNALYNGAVVKIVPINVVITPLRPGKLSFGPLTTRVVVRIPAQRRSNDPMSLFDSGLFRRTEPRQVSVSMPQQVIEVLPLPTDNVPRSFTGALGQFEMQVTAGPTNVTVGDPITVRVQIQGVGTLGSVSLQDPVVSSDFKVYDAESQLETQDEFGFVGTKTIEQIVIPENSEVTALPAIEFTYFDPEAETYRTLTHPPTPLQVAPAGSRPTPLVGERNSSLPPPKVRDDIVHIKQRMGSTGSIQETAGVPTRFIAWNGLPLLAWAGTVAWRKRRESRRRNPRLQRQIEVRRLLAQGFQSLETHASTGDAEAFFSTVFRMLQEQLGLTLDLPASGVTELVIDNELASTELPEPSLAALRELFQACDAARYAPTRDRQELTALIPTLRAVMDDLQEVSS